MQHFFFFREIARFKRFLRLPSLPAIFLRRAFLRISSGSFFPPSIGSHYRMRVGAANDVILFRMANTSRLDRILQIYLAGRSAEKRSVATEGILRRSAKPPRSRNQNTKCWLGGSPSSMIYRLRIMRPIKRKLFTTNAVGAILALGEL